MKHLLKVILATIILLTASVNVSAQDPEEEVSPYVSLQSTPAQVQLLGSDAGDISLVEINFDILSIPATAEVTAAQLTYLQEGTSNGIVRFVNKEHSDIIDAKALSNAGPKQITGLSDIVTGWIRGDVAGIIVQASELETDAEVDLTTITLDIAYSIPDSVDPQFNQLEVYEIGSDSVTFYWEVTEPVTVTIDYGKTSNYGQTVEVNRNELFVDYTLSSLSPGVTYHYMVTIEDAAGNRSKTRNSTFTTSLGSEVLGAGTITVGEDILRPPALTSIELNPEDAIRTVYVNWRNLAQGAIDGFVIYRSSDEGATYKEVKRVGPQTLTLEDTGISGNSTYYYAVRVLSGEQQSELSGPLAVFIPDVVADQIRISSEETVEAIGRTTLVLIAGGGLVFLVVVIVLRKLLGVKNSDEPLTKKAYTRNILRDPEYYSEEF